MSAETPPGLLIRAGRTADLAALTDIINHYIRESQCTFDVEPFTPAARQGWFAGFAERGPYRLLVMESAEGILGYACSTPFRPKAAYARTVETSVYLRPGAEGRGLGQQLYGALFAELEEEPVHRALAIIAQPNPASVALHIRLGFRSAGVMREVGFKFERYWDAELFARTLPGG
jgi:phosphinothricin acetyltransferase